MRAAALLALAYLVACTAARPPAAPSPPTRVASNVLRGDYAGSEECQYCHAGIYKRWLDSPMHRMTRLADPADIRAPFDGTTFSFKGDQVRMETRDGRRYMRVTTRARGEQLYRVTRVIGGRTREDFVGIADDAHAAEEVVLPVTWVYSTGSWRYKGYSVMVSERPALSVGPVWRQNCIFCHNTVPYFSTVLDNLFGPGAPVYQGSISDDRFLPGERQLSFQVTAPERLVTAARAELAFLGDHSPPDGLSDVLRELMETTRRRFGGDQLVEVGIGCEACHGGARAHIDDPRQRPTFRVESDFFSVGEMSPARTINRTCARCHTVLFSRYPWTWEGGLRNSHPGGSSINSGEARDFLLGGCAEALSCADCHDPHTRDSAEHYRELEGAAGNALCSRCHPGKDAPAHTHHAAGAGCLGCHMPRKNMSLEYGLSRYHRIGSPTDKARVEGDRPLECALCHTDRSVEQLAGEMERGWRVRIDRAALRRLYGDDLSVNAIRATLERGRPHEQAVAITLLGEQKVGSAAAAIVPHLGHEYPLLRFYARRALESIEGRPLSIDLDGDAAAIRAEGERWLKASAR